MTGRMSADPGPRTRRVGRRDRCFPQAAIKGQRAPLTRRILERRKTRSRAADKVIGRVHAGTSRSARLTYFPKQQKSSALHAPPRNPPIASAVATASWTAVVFYRFGIERHGTQSARKIGNPRPLVISLPVRLVRWTSKASGDCRSPRPLGSLQRAWRTGWRFIGRTPSSRGSPDNFGFPCPVRASGW